MTALAILLTVFILSGATFVICFAISEVEYKNEPDPKPLQYIGGLSFLSTFLSLVGALISTVWVVLT